jgi:hypothetical protein
VTLPLTSPFTTGTAVTKAQLDQLVTAVNALWEGPRGLLGESHGTLSTNNNLTTTGTYFGSTGQKVTVTLTETRRLRIAIQAMVAPNTSAAAQYFAGVGQATGTGIAGATIIGDAFRFVSPSGTSNALSGFTEATVLLSAGTYTFCALAQRASGGDPGDQLTRAIVAVYDQGNS